MSINSAEQTVANHHSIASHIRDLLPLQKHALFHVKLVIHQLQSVPLVSGEFKIKWKFRHLQPVNSAGRPLGFGRALALKLDGQKKKRAESINASDIGKGKGKSVDIAQEDRDQEDVQGENESTLPLPGYLASVGRSSSTNFERSQSKLSTSSNSTSNSTFNLSSNLSTQAVSENLGIDYHSHARGHTPFLPLRDFNVDFESEINVAVQMPIEKDTLALLPSQLKLTVRQRVIPNDPDSPVNPRLGHVEVNLAEYVVAGPVTRTYLLRRSKVNAMLHMTITMTQISGEENFRAPPLRKEEIKAGISDFLTASSVPLPSLSKYMPVDDPWLSSSLGEFVKLDEGGMHIPQVDEADDNPESSFDVPAQPLRPRKRWHVGSGKRTGSGGHFKTDDATPPLPSKVNHTSTTPKEQLHPTEALIEAIFNPYPTASETASPFTYYLPPSPPSLPQPRHQDSWGSEGNGTDGTSRGSFDSSQRVSASASASASASTSTSEHGHEAGSSGVTVSGHKWWRRKTGSRPITPL